MLLPEDAHAESWFHVELLIPALKIFAKRMKLRETVNLH